MRLLQGLTEASPGWLVWRNTESALTGTGDIDAAADETDWPVIEAEVRRWAVEQDVGPVVVCHHIATPAGHSALPLSAVDPAGAG
jgi:hypothetical protein